jgi:hypothetical protein
MIDKSTLRATLSNLAKRGWYLFPLKPDSKLPAIRGYLEEATTDLDKLMRWADRFHTTNFGVSLAKSGLVAVDIDKGGLDKWDALCFHHGEPETLKVRSGSGIGSHYIFKAKKSTRYRGKIITGIDVKHNGFVVVPGSTHPKTGKLYQFVKDREPAQNPPWLGELIEKQAGAKGRASNVYGFAGADWYQKIIDQLKEKEFGHDEWVRLGMSLHAAFEGSDDGLALFQELSRGVNYQEGDDDIAEKKWESFSNKSGNVSAGTFVYVAKELGCTIPAPGLERDKKESFGKIEVPDEEPMGDDEFEPEPEWNQNTYGHKSTTDAEFLVQEVNKLGYAMLGGSQEGKIIKHWKDRNGITQFKMLSGEDFKNSLASLSYRFRNPDTGRKQNAPASQVWLKSTKKSTFRNIVFKPDADFEDLNLWADIPCVGKKGDSSLALELIHVLCGEDALKASYFIKWLAHLVQRPWEKCVVVPVIIGEQGTGKGLLTDHILANMLGPFYIRIDKAGVIKERFNAEQAKKFLTVLDEASWRGDHELSSIMKSLTGNATMTVEEKFGGRYAIENYSRYLITSNDFDAIRLEISNRRYLVLEASTKWKGSEKFAKLAELIRKGQLAEIFFDYLSNVDISDFDSFAFPENLDNVALATKMHSLGAVGEFWHRTLLETPTPIIRVVHGKPFLDKDFTYSLFSEFRDASQSYGRGITPVVFWKETHNMIPAIKDKIARPRFGNFRKRGFEAWPIDLARSFCTKTRIPFVEDEFDDLEFVIDNEFDSVESN